MISERISDDIPPQMKILNMVIPILMHFCSGALQAACNPMICDVINDVKLFPYDILSQIFDVIQSNVVLQKQVH